MNKYVTKLGFGFVMFGTGLLMLTLVSLHELNTTKNFIPSTITIFSHMFMIASSSCMIGYGVTHD